MKRLNIFLTIAALVTLSISASTAVRAKNETPNSARGYKGPCSLTALDYDQDHRLSLGDAVNFTKYYFADDADADVTQNGVVNNADAKCADIGYTNGTSW